MRIKQILIIIIVVIISGFFGYRFGLSQGGQFLKSIVEPGSMVTEASYIIFTDGMNVYARDGNTGEIVKNSNNASEVLQYTIDKSINGGKIFVKGLFIIKNDFVIPAITEDLTIEGMGYSPLSTNYYNESTLAFINSTITNSLSSNSAGRLILKNLNLEFSNVVNRSLIFLNYITPYFENVKISETGCTWPASTGYINMAVVFANVSGPPGVHNVFRDVRLRLTDNYALGFYFHKESVVWDNLYIDFTNCDNARGICLVGVNLQTINNLYVWFNSAADNDQIIQLSSSSADINVLTVSTQAGAGTNTPNVVFSKSIGGLGYISVGWIYGDVTYGSTPTAPCYCFADATVQSKVTINRFQDQEPGSMVTEVSYIIFKDDYGNIYARNGNTGEIEFSGTDDSTIIQVVIDKETQSGFATLKLVFKKGKYDIKSDITFPRGQIIFEGEGRAQPEHGQSMNKGVQINLNGGRLLDSGIWDTVIHMHDLILSAQGTYITTPIDLPKSQLNLDNVLIYCNVSLPTNGVFMSVGSTGPPATPTVWNNVYIWDKRAAGDYSMLISIRAEGLVVNGLGLTLSVNSGSIVNPRLFSITGWGTHIINGLAVYQNAGSPVKYQFQFQGYGTLILNSVEFLKPEFLSGQHIWSQGVGQGTTPLYVELTDGAYQESNTPMVPTTYNPADAVVYLRLHGRFYQNSGVATSITDGYWQKHGLTDTPTIVTLTPRSQATVWVNDRNATHFQVGVSSGTVTVDWYAEV